MKKRNFIGLLCSAIAGLFAPRRKRKIQFCYRVRHAYMPRPIDPAAVYAFIYRK